MSNALILLDESGDLGWKLDQPYRNGGSSRYFSIGLTIGANNSHRKFGQLVRGLHKSRKWTSAHERKWTNIGTSAQKEFAKKTIDLIARCADVKIVAGTINKANVPSHIRGHHHLIYAWLTSCLLKDSVGRFRTVSICPDDLNDKGGNGRIFETIIRNDMWFHENLTTEINRIPRVSALEDGLLFCDYLAGAVQSHFEDGISDAYNILRPSLAITER